MNLELHYNENDVMGVLIDIVEKRVVKVFIEGDAQSVLDLVHDHGYSVNDVIEMVS